MDPSAKGFREGMDTIALLRQVRIHRYDHQGFTR
jgi:hypothetical protein